MEHIGGKLQIYIKTEGKNANISYE
jgi:hypothetical protein